MFAGLTTGVAQTAQVKDGAWTWRASMTLGWLKYPLRQKGEMVGNGLTGIGFGYGYGYGGTVWVRERGRSKL